jgi:hypothetical protein
MARRSVHIPKTALSARKRESLRRSDFAVPSERKYPINDLFHARLALTYALTPSNAAYRDEVVSAVLARYPELKFWWAARSKRLAAPARRKVANPSYTSHISEDTMPVYTLNPSHRRAAKRKASSAPSLRERVAAKRNNPRAKAPTRKDELQRLAHAAGYHVEAYSPGDGMTRYRFFDLAEMDRKGVSVREMSYFGPLNGVDTALGLAAAKKWLSKSHMMRRNGLSEDGTVVSNPRRRAGGRSAQKAGLKKGQSLMVQAAAAYRAGKYATMQAALKGVARRKNPLSEDGVIVSNPKRKVAVKRATKRTAAQSNAAKAMKLFHSGKASSLAEAWDMVRRGR